MRKSSKSFTFWGMFVGEIDHEDLVYCNAELNLIAQYIVRMCLKSKMLLPDRSLLLIVNCYWKIESKYSIENVLLLLPIIFILIIIVWHITLCLLCGAEIRCLFDMKLIFVFNFEEPSFGWGWNLFDFFTYCANISKTKNNPLDRLEGLFIALLILAQQQHA